MGNFFFVICLGLILAFLVWIAPEPIEYTVQVVYCDNRPSKQIQVKSHVRPSNFQIDNYRNGVPEYNGELNVCEVNIIK